MTSVVANRPQRKLSGRTNRKGNPARGLIDWLKQLAAEEAGRSGRGGRQEANGNNSGGGGATRLPPASANRRLFLVEGCVPMGRVRGREGRGGQAGARERSGGAGGDRGAAAAAAASEI